LSEYNTINLSDIEIPGIQDQIVNTALREGKTRIFWPNYNGGPVYVILPHRLQANFVCNKCMKSVVVKYFTADVIRGYIARTRKCECGGTMTRRFIGCERDVPVEMNSTPIGIEEYLTDVDE